MLNCTKTGAEKVVTSAAWLHDVLDHKMITDPDEYSRKEKVMKEFLTARFSEKQVNLIFDIIANVSFSKEVRYFLLGSNMKTLYSCSAIVKFYITF